MGFGTPLTQENLLCAYLDAKEFIVAQGYGREIDWQDGLRFASITETDFLREYAWVVLAAGIRETVVRKKFSAISFAFLDWRGAADIAACAGQCHQQALQVFNHGGKIGAIVGTALLLARSGFDTVRSRLHNEGPLYLRTLPFIGPVTAFHLAKNLGLDVVKPDRHLVRVARATGFSEAIDLCKAISALVGDRVAVVDLVIWRYATLEQNYEAHFGAARLRPTPK